MMRRHHLVLSLVALTMLMVSVPFTADAKPAPKRAATKPASYADGDVRVTKNPDGTVEVSDVDSPAAASSSAQTAPSQSSGPVYTHTVISRPAPPATLRYGDGVVVRRNADGSVEVTDEDSQHPQMQSFGGGYVAPRRAARRTSVKRKHK